MRVERTKEGWYNLMDHNDVPMIVLNRAELESLHESVKAALDIEQTVQVPRIPPGLHKSAVEAMERARSA
jgi:hypothetical protein